MNRSLIYYRDFFKSFYYELFALSFALLSASLVFFLGQGLIAGTLLLGNVLPLSLMLKERHKRNLLPLPRRWLHLRSSINIDMNTIKDRDLEAIANAAEDCLSSYRFLPSELKIHLYDIPDRVIESFAQATRLAEMHIQRETQIEILKPKRNKESKDSKRLSCDEKSILNEHQNALNVVNQKLESIESTLKTVARRIEAFRLEWNELSVDHHINNENSSIVEPIKLLSEALEQIDTTKKVRANEKELSQ